MLKVSMDEDAVKLLASTLKRQQRHGDLFLIQSSLLPDNLMGEDLAVLCKHLKCKRLAAIEKISENGFRTPKVRLLFGQSTVVEHKDNGVIYRFDIAKNMFSIGNISEKIRVSKMECDNQVIVDLFCGIGYFTLQFLKHCGASLVHACDWNPDAIYFLNQNLSLNKIDADRCVVHFGDNRETCPVNVADRVYLGLIPSSRGSWRIACRALKSTTGGILHIHDNVSFFADKDKTEVYKDWQKDVLSELKSIFDDLYPGSHWQVTAQQVTRVKSYAPHIDHCVLDVRCAPNCSH